ncbi:hypothetical protein HPB48_010196 [Haemaphysalis longicornis]|uniref:Uncharacterized protein n=1 Tax=Haemaphysalis longicornis TaxID=44386 RepID=A0A9J6GN59_HAELO|nr:hypothetical protein HPB48_010196 [Haemaphysalis longicornis]
MAEQQIRGAAKEGNGGKKVAHEKGRPFSPSSGSATRAAGGTYETTTRGRKATTAEDAFCPTLDKAAAEMGDRLTGPDLLPRPLPRSLLSEGGRSSFFPASNYCAAFRREICFPKHHPPPPPLSPPPSPLRAACKIASVLLDGITAQAQREEVAAEDDAQWEARPSGHSSSRHSVLSISAPRGRPPRPLPTSSTLEITRPPQYIPQRTRKNCGRRSFRIPERPSSKGRSHARALRAFREISAKKNCEAPNDTLLPVSVPSHQPQENAAVPPLARGLTCPHRQRRRRRRRFGNRIPSLSSATSFPDEKPAHPGRHSRPAPITRSSATSPSTAPSTLLSP